MFGKEDSIKLQITKGKNPRYVGRACEKGTFHAVYGGHGDKGSGFMGLESLCRSRYWKKMLIEKKDNERYCLLKPSGSTGNVDIEVEW